MAANSETPNTPEAPNTLEVLMWDTESADSAESPDSPETAYAHLQFAKECIEKLGALNQASPGEYTLNFKGRKFTWRHKVSESPNGLRGASEMERAAQAGSGYGTSRLAVAEQQYKAAQQAMHKLTDYIAETGQCPHEEFGEWKDCQDKKCQKLKGKQPKDKSAHCWRKWSGCPTCNKGFGQPQQPTPPPQPDNHP